VVICWVHRIFYCDNQYTFITFYHGPVHSILRISFSLNSMFMVDWLLTTLNNCHPSVQFTMELAENGTLPLLGMSLTKQGREITNSVYRKSTNKGLFLHYQSHVDNRYKKSLLKTMLHRAHSLSSADKLFRNESDNIKSIFFNLKYPSDLIETAISTFTNTSRDKTQSQLYPIDVTENSNTIRIVLPFIDQKPADIVKRQLTQLNKKLNTDLQPVFVSWKLENVLKYRETNPPLVNQQLVVYHFQCGSCDANYVGYTARHLHQRIKEHRYSSIGKHRLKEHGLTTAPPSNSFSILKKCTSKFDCLVYEMLYIKELTTTLNVQTDSVKAKLFI